MKKRSRQIKGGYVMVYKHKDRTAQIPTPLAAEKQLKFVQALASLKQLLLLFFG